MLELTLVVMVVIGGVWAVAVFHLRGADMSAFDRPVGERFSRGDAPGPEIQAVIASLGGIRELLKGVPMRQRNAVLRKYMDGIFADRVLDVSITAVDCAGVPAEWVLAPGADPQRRTLYIHGGAFMMGSPKSHRTLTSRFSAADWRRGAGHRLPADARAPAPAGIDDCRGAYRWLLEHGAAGRGTGECGVRRR